MKKFTVTLRVRHSMDVPIKRTIADRVLGNSNIVHIDYENVVVEIVSEDLAFAINDVWKNRNSNWRVSDPLHEAARFMFKAMAGDIMSCNIEPLKVH